MVRSLAVALLALAAVACTGAQKKADPVATPKPGAAAGEDLSVVTDNGGFSRANPGEEVQEVDINDDQRADIVKFWAGKAPQKEGDAGTLVRKEVDLNHDGKVDQWNWYGTDGTVARQSYDLDFDGRVDVSVFYEKSVVVRKEVFHDFQQRPDTFKYYEKGKLVRIERDRSGDGRIDTWEYWEGEAVDRIGEDVNGDGTVDRWVKPKKES